MARKNILVVMSLLLGGIAALECDIPGECIGQLIGFTSQDSSTECLSTCKGMCAFAKGNNILIGNLFQVLRDAPGTHLGLMSKSVPSWKHVLKLMRTLVKAVSVVRNFWHSVQFIQ